MRYDAEHKARTRERVVRAAAEAIRSDGPQAMGVAEVMGRAGLTHGGFYAHFASKDALVADAIDQAFADGRERVHQAGEADAPPADALRAFVRRYLSRAHRDDAARGCPVPALTADAPRLGPEARARFGAGVARLTARLEGLLEGCGRPEPRRLAASVIAELQGALALARAVPDAEQSDAILHASRHAVLERLGLQTGDAP